MNAKYIGTFCILRDYARIFYEVYPNFHLLLNLRAVKLTRDYRPYSRITIIGYDYILGEYLIGLYNYTWHTCSYHIRVLYQRCRRLSICQSVHLSVRLRARV